MQYVLENDELYFMCALAGADEVLGIGEPLEKIEKPTVEEKWNEVEKRLKNKQYITRESDGKKILKDDICLIVSVISFPNIVYSVTRRNSNGNKSTGHIYIKPYMCVHLETQDNKTYTINTYERIDDFKLFLSTYLNFINLKETDEKYFISTTSKTIDYALECVNFGNLKKGVDIIADSGISKREITEMLNAYSNVEKTIQVSAFMNEEEKKEALFSISFNEKSTWMMKLTSTDEFEKTSIYKSDKDEMIKALFAF
ncbi:UNVERIFIED_CONTAM: hypothetical protein Cloal_2537 [Acetivibrio alkalicellulosi]